MSQSLLYHAFGVREGYEYQKTEYVEGRVEFHLRVEKGLLKCRDCGRGPAWRRGSRERRIRTLPIGLREVVLVAEVAHCQCQHCGKTFDVSPFARAYAHYTHALARFVCALSRWMTLSEVAALTHLGWATVKGIVKADLSNRYSSVSIKEVKRIAIDEIYVGKKAKFLTLVIDLDTGQIIHVAKGRGKEALIKFWRRVRKSKARIEAAACDMSAAYWSAILENLPDAALVFDHFHVIKMANEKIDELRRALWREAGILQRNAIKGSRYLLLMGAENLPDDRREQLQEALRFNEPLSVAYYLKEELRLLWSQPSFERMTRFLHNWCAQAMASGIAQMMSLAKTLRAHATGILNYFHHPISTGKLEGINNKVACLKRAAYGYRDHEFFTLKLYSLHESSLRLSGV